MEKFKAAWLKIKTFSNKGKDISISKIIIIALPLILFVSSFYLIHFFQNTCLSTYLSSTNNSFIDFCDYLKTLSLPSETSNNENAKYSIGTLIERTGYMLGGLIASYVAIATFWRASAADKTAEAQKETAVEQEKGNFQERYKDAVNQLNNNEASIRLAGFYGLYHLAQDNDKYSRTICDILCAYVRERTNSIITIPRVITKTENILYRKKHAREPEKTENTFYKEKYSKEPDNEIQSIINLLTKEKEGEKKPFQSEWVDFSGAYLAGANFAHSILNKAHLQKVQLQEAVLYHAQLQGAFLENAQLQGAFLENVQLQGANLQKVQLQGANLSFAQMQRALLSSARLQGAILFHAQLQGTLLSSARLQGADLSSTQLQGANLYSAQLQGTILRKAQLQRAELSSAQMQGADLFNTLLQGADLNSAQLQGADLNSVHLQGAVLRKAQMQGANLSDAQLQGANLHEAQLQGADLNKINLVSAVASSKILTYNSPDAAEQLKSRIGNDTDLQTAVFSGGVNSEDIENLKREIQDVKTHLKGYSLENFQDKMRRVIQILDDHKNKDSNTNFPPEGYTTISAEDYKKLSEKEQKKEKYIITGMLDKATADKTIKELKAIEKEVAEINKKYFIN